MSWFRCTGGSGGSLKLRTASGAIATFETNIADVLQSVKCEINAKQDLHGYPSPWIDSNVINKTPYLSRSLSGTASRIGNYEFNKLVGGSYAWNQMIQNGNFADDSIWGWSSVASHSVANNIATVTFKDQEYNHYIAQTITKRTANHVYVITATAQSTDKPNGMYFFFYSQNFSQSQAFRITNNISTKTRLTMIIKPTIDFSIVAFRFVDGTGGGSATIENCMLIDLTQMMGSAIADHIYSLEQATAGAGVSYFRALFPDDYYAYNVGDLISVKPTAHITKKSGGSVIQTIALDPNLELRGVLMLDENNKLYYDGDTYSSDGSVSRKYGIVTLDGSQEVAGSYSNAVGNTIVRFNIADIKPNSANTEIPKLVNSGGVNVYSPDMQYGSTYGANSSLTVRTNDTNIMICLAGVTSKDDVLAYLANNPITVVYEKATATSENAQAFNNPVAIDANGSEEFTDSRAVAIPVGHESYYANICPIVGHTELNLTRCGVNLWDGVAENGYIYNGTEYPSTSYWRTKNYIPIAPNTEYYFRASANDGQINWYDINKTFISAEGSMGGADRVATSPANAYFVRFYQPNSSDASDAGVNYPSSDTSYHAYNGQTFTVAFGQTVYGGVYDKSGRMTITWAGTKIKDLGWYYDTDYQRFYSTDQVDIKHPPTQDDTPYILCDIYNPISFSGFMNLPRPDNVISNPNANGRINIRDTRFTDTTTFIASVGEYYLAYELATPIVIDVQAVSVSAENGTNNVFGDTGDTEVKYLYKEAGE